MKRRKKYWINFQFRNTLFRKSHSFFEDFSFYLGLFVFLSVAYDVGFPHFIKYIYFAVMYLIYLTAFTVTLGLRNLLNPKDGITPKILQWLPVVFLAIFCYYKYTAIQLKPDYKSYAYYGSLILCFVLILLDSSRKVLLLYTKRFNPALAFVISFLLLSLMGCGLLLLPRATVNGISFTDALFTSVSAVCVTGLSTLDTATEFTRLGKFFILILIQLGGLGILSFTSFFGYLYKGGFSIENQLFLKDFVTAERVSDTFKSLAQIIVITLLVEVIGVACIYLTVGDAAFGTSGQKLRFSIFHAISAFCNAGFSTIPGGLFNTYLATEYDFQFVICILVLIGGIGFPIITDFYYYTIHYLRQIFGWLFDRKPIRHLPRTVSINTTLVLVTSFILLTVGMVTFSITENHGILANHDSVLGKVMTTFFASVTPRTAGFNTFDMSLMQPATVLIYLLLMWIGASPASTGGGIKTSTFAVAMLNILSLARGKDRVEYRRRQIPTESVRRAFSTIMLSLLAIGPAILFITVLEPEKQLIKVAFECFSAFSTVGLTLGITPLLSDAGKFVLIFLMFVGRVGTFTLFVAFVRQVRTINYRYPNETIFIN
jgi:potassium uptake TrkH family protein